MAKLPYMQFYPADWLLDTLMLSPQSRGIWIDILSIMWRAEPRTGVMEWPVDVWCKRLRCTDAQFRLTVEEFELERICDVVKDACKDIVRFTSRRMVRDEKLRGNNKLYVGRHRSKITCKTDVRPLKGVCKGENQNQSHISESESEVIKEKKEKTLAHSSQAVCVVDPFDQFWMAYPKKVGKKAALQAWNKAKDKPQVADILQAIDNAKNSAQWTKEDGQFIPNPSTWLHQGRWADQPLEKKKSLYQEFAERHQGGNHGDGLRTVLQGVARARGAAMGPALPRPQHLERGAASDDSDSTGVVLQETIVL